MAQITGWGRLTWGEGPWNKAVPVELTGVAATGAVGTVLVWGEIIPEQTPNWVEIAA